MTKRPAAELISAIRRDIIEARYNFDVYRTYKLKEIRKKYEKVFVVHGAFIMCDLRAHFASLIVTLGRIFDSNTKCIGIPALLESDPHFQKIATQQYQRALKLWRDDKILVLRHQVVAHRSSSKTLQELFAIPKTTLDKFTELITLLDELIDAWSREAKCHVYFASKMRPHLDSLLNTLERGS